MPVIFSARARSASSVAGVMLSTIVRGQVTSASIQRARSTSEVCA